MTLDSPIRFCWAADDSEAWISAEKRISWSKCQLYASKLVFPDTDLDQDSLNGYTPFLSNVADDFRNFEGDHLSFGDKGLHQASTNHMTKSGLSTLDKSLTKIGNSKCGTVRVGYLVIDDRVNFDVDVVTSDDSLGVMRV